MTIPVTIATRVWVVTWPLLALGFVGFIPSIYKHWNEFVETVANGRKRNDFSAVMLFKVLVITQILVVYGICIAMALLVVD